MALKKRLEILRADCREGDTWRTRRHCNFINVETYTGYGLFQSINSAGKVWLSFAPDHFRDERDAHNVIRLDYTGWYSDMEQDDLYIGIIARLSHGRYIAGYRWTCNDERVYFNQIFTDKTDAARMADAHAEQIAELSREDAEKWNAAQKLESDIDSYLLRLRECLALRHKKCMDYVQDEISALCQKIRENRETLKTEFKDFI